MNFEFAPEFAKDLKQLGKKWRSLPSDIREVQAGIMPLYVAEDGVDIELLRRGFFNGKRAAILLSGDGFEVVKMRLDVADLGTNSKVRIVFVAKVQANTVTFIELYAKNDKPREDTARIKKYTGK